MFRKLRLSKTLDPPRESAMHTLLLTLVAFSSGVLCNPQLKLTDTVNWILDTAVETNKQASHATADSVASIVNITAPVIYLSAQQVLFANELPDMVRKGTKACNTHLKRDDFVVHAGMGAHKLHTRPREWNQARETCMAEGGTLAIINSVEEEKMLLNWMREHHVYLTWLGIHDLFEEGKWVTLTGETLEAAGYDVWEKNEPNNGFKNEHCGILVHGGGMNDIQCDRMIPFFCEIKQC